MKKTKFIALVLIVSVMMMGAGYAWWNDSVRIDNTVTTGELKVEFETDRVLGEFWGDDERGRTYAVQPYFPTDGVGNKTMTASLEKLFPTDDVFSVVSVKITNSGSVAAKFGSADVKANASGQMKEKLNARVYINKPFVSGETINWHADQNATGTLGDLKSTIETALAGIEIEPGQTRLFRIRYNLDPSAGNNLQNSDAEPEITLNWVQYNQD